jgi:HK97 family phage portal protein
LRGGLPNARSGARVTAETALYVSTVLACCRVIANGLSQVPFRLYIEKDAHRLPASEHPLFRLLTRRPNPWQTSYEFRETIVFHALLTGNAYIFVNRVGIAREIRELIPLEPKHVEVKRKDDLTLEYKVSNAQGASQTFGRDAIWHLRGPSWNTWQGLDIIKLAREAVGLAITLEQSQAEFQRNGAQTSGVLAPKDKLSPERFGFLAAWIDKHLPGGERFGKPLIVDDGATYTTMSMTAIDQQLVESRKMQIEEICREFGVMPIMVGYSDKAATYASPSRCSWRTSFTACRPGTSGWRKAPT